MPSEPIGKITGADGSDQTSRDRSKDGTIVINPTFHKYKFMIPAMPWHDVMCPACNGMGHLAIEIMHGEQTGTQVSECDLCGGAGEIKEHQRKKYESENSDG